jgi:hypothetical protein
VQCNLLELRELASLAIVGTEDPKKLTFKWAHLLRLAYPREVQLPFAYLALIAHLLKLEPLSICPEVMAGGACDICSHGILAGYRIPDPGFAAELGSLWMILGLCQKNESLVFAGLKVAYFQLHQLPHLTLWRKDSQNSESMHGLLFTLAHRISGDSAFTEHKTKSRLIRELLSLVPEKLACPIRLPYKFVPDEKELGMVKFNTGEGSFMCGLSGRNSGVFSYHKKEVALVNAGPIVGAIDSLERFGIEREVGKFNDMVWEKSAHHFRLQGWTKVFSCQTWMEVETQFHTGRVVFNGLFYGQERPAFVLYGRSDKLMLGGKTSFQPHGLQRYQGKSLPIELITEREALFIEGTGEMEVVSLGEGSSYFGAQFLIAYFGDGSLELQIK